MRARPSAAASNLRIFKLLTVELQDVEAALVVDRVHDVFRDPVGSRGATGVRQVVTDLGQLPVLPDLDEARAVVVEASSDEAPVVELRVRVEPVGRAAERSVDRGA